MKITGNVGVSNQRLKNEVNTYDIYRVYSKELYDDIENDNFESGYLDLSLSYEDQLDFLISKLKAASDDYLSKGD